MSTAVHEATAGLVKSITPTSNKVPWPLAPKHMCLMGGMLFTNSLTCTRVICLQLNGASMFNGTPEKLEYLWQDITHEFGTSLGKTWQKKVLGMVAFVTYELHTLQVRSQPSYMYLLMVIYKMTHT